MTMIPALDDRDEIEYRWYVGDYVKTVGLWKRTPTYGFPIYQNTRGKAIFNAAEIERGNIESTEPTAAFFDVVAAIPDPDAGVIDTEGCEWYEREFVGELFEVAASCDDGDLPVEIGQLIDYAQEVVSE